MSIREMETSQKLLEVEKWSPEGDETTKKDPDTFFVSRLREVEKVSQLNYQKGSWQAL